MITAQESKIDKFQGEMPSNSSDISLGVFTVVAMILMLWGYCWLKAYPSLAIPQRFTVIFGEVAGLNENAAVYVDGVRVGTVEKLEWKAKHYVNVRLRINSSELRIPVGSKFEILTNGIVGAKYVQIDLPTDAIQQGNAAMLDESSIVYGERPVRPELAVNKLAITLSDIDMKQVGRDFKADRIRLIRAADQLAILADKTMPVIDRVYPLENEMSGLTKDMRRVSRRIADVIDDPNFSSDLKETAHCAKETVLTLQSTIHELNTTLGDKPLRQDVLVALERLNSSTRNIADSMSSLQSIAGDNSLRSDIKQILQEAHSALNTVNEITSKPIGDSDLSGALKKTNDAITHFDLAARQMNQILGKRSPIMHLVFGRPGYIKEEKESKQTRTESETPILTEIHENVNN
jgi:hypothetical protein